MSSSKSEALRIISMTLSALLAVRGWRGTVRFTVHVDAHGGSLRVVPDVYPEV